MLHECCFTVTKVSQGAVNSAASNTIGCSFVDSGGGTVRVQLYIRFLLAINNTTPAAYLLSLITPARTPLEAALVNLFI